MINDLESRGITFVAAMVYIRALHALRLTENDRCDAIAAMVASGGNRCSLPLRLITSRLSNNPLNGEDAITSSNT